MIETTNSTGTNGSAAGSTGSSSSGITGKAGETYKAARERTMSAYDAARGRAADVTRQAGSYPVAAVVGGLAVGALVGFLLPSTRREQEMLAPTGKKITEAAREATQRGIDAGKEQIDEIRTKATQKVGEAVVEAVASATGKE